mmetsp:Transcript_97513/g.281373  ORF Transcript_97513/g.281373 Transcript_97513/m.281373 type:complete len:444 (+) Transcript_97513:106-1437(+)
MMPETVAASRYVSEFVGTYLLVVTVGCNVLSGSAVWAALSAGCVLMVAVYALSASSGAHFNPAVSLAMGLVGKLPWDEVCIYAVVQTLAGGLGAGTYLVMFEKSFTLRPGDGYSIWHAGAVEGLYTFMLCFVYLNSVCKRHTDRDQLFGLAIGAVIVAGGYAAGHISGGCFNPALAFGIDVTSGKLFLSIVYAACQLLGGGLASTLYLVVRPDDFTSRPIDSYPLASTLTSEFVGTFLVVLTAGLAALGRSPAAALAVAAAVVSMVFALSSCSGAHFNPAVTLSVLASARARCNPTKGMWYILVQLLAAITAAFACSALEHGRTFALGPGRGFGWGSAGVAEILFTFLVCFAYLTIFTTVVGNYQVLSLVVGACVAAAGFAVGSVSGALLNPALAAGISIAHVVHGGALSGLVLYTGAHLTGASTAALAFMATHPSEYSKLPM